MISKKMELIKGTESLTFTRGQQLDLFEALRDASPTGVARRVALENLTRYVDNIIKDTILPKKVLEHYDKSPEFFNTTKAIRINSSDLGICDKFFPSGDTKSGNSITTDLQLELGNHIPYQKDGSSYVYDITKELKKLGGEKSNTLKELLLTYINSEYERRLFTIPEWCEGDQRARWCFYPFKKIKTWGRLYHVNPEWYAVLLDIYPEEVENVKKNIIGGSIPDTINNMKTLVDYV